MIAPSRMASKCSRRNTLRLPVAVTNRSPHGRRLAGGHDLVAVHQRLERPNRVHLDDGHVGPMPAIRMAMPRPTQP